MDPLYPETHGSFMPKTLEPELPGITILGLDWIANPRKWNPHRSDTKAEATQVPNPKGRKGKETKKPR
jgi:hypothetical protein